MFEYARRNSDRENARVESDSSKSSDALDAVAAAPDVWAVPCPPLCQLEFTQWKLRLTFQHLDSDDIDHSSRPIRAARPRSRSDMDLPIRAAILVSLAFDTSHTYYSRLLPRRPIMTKPRHRNETAFTSSDQPPAVSPPSGIDPDWRERIEIAKQAREQARKARGDRPATFDRRGLPISW